MSSVQMRLVRELPVVTCWASHNGKTVQLEALVDTGSAGTMLKTDVADALGISHTNATGVYTVVGVQPNRQLNRQVRTQVQARPACVGEPGQNIRR